MISSLALEWLRSGQIYDHPRAKTAIMLQATPVERADPVERTAPGGKRALESG